MTTGGAEPIGWDAVLEELLESMASTREQLDGELARVDPIAASELRTAIARRRDLEDQVIRSDALRKAFEGTGEWTLGEMVGRVRELLGFLLRICEAQQYCSDPHHLLNPTSEVRRRRELAIAQLAAPDRELLAEQIRNAPIPRNVRQVIGSDFDRENLRSKGDGGFASWMVRELAERVPPKAPKRLTAISELLTFADVYVEPGNVGNILKRR